MAKEIKVYTILEVAKIFGVTRRSVYSWLKEGKIKAFKVGREWRFTEEALRDFMKTGTGTETRTGTPGSRSTARARTRKDSPEE